MAAGGERNERHPEVTVAAGRAQRRAATRTAAGMLKSDSAPVRGATGGKWPRRWLRGTLRAGRTASNRGPPLDVIVNATSGPPAKGADWAGYCQRGAAAV
jgi:hypothetical protein